MAATVALSIATTLITLAIEHMHRARRASAATVHQAGAQAAPAIAEPEAEPGGILSGHHGTDSRL